MVRFGQFVRAIVLFNAVSALLFAEGPIRLLKPGLITQDKTSWNLDYVFENTTPVPLVLKASEVYGDIEAWVSNSSIDAHATPRKANHEIRILAEPGARHKTEVIQSTIDEENCIEWLTTDIWEGETPGRADDRGIRDRDLTIQPGARFFVRLRFDHQHLFYDPYQLLFGSKEIILNLGPAARFSDSLKFDHESYFVWSKEKWPDASSEHLDDFRFRSAPQSLSLVGNSPGLSFVRFPELKVRYGTRMKLVYWYFIEPGSEGIFYERTTQWRNFPNSATFLSEATVLTANKVEGRWTKVEKIIKIDRKATHLAMDFRFGSGTEAGEVWVDDIDLQPADAAMVVTASP